MATAGRSVLGLGRDTDLKIDETVAGTIWLIGIAGIGVVWVIVGSLTGPRR
jgi:hypothetical protein